MGQKSRYGHRYVAGPIEATKEKWSQFVAEIKGDELLTQRTQFIPVLGGCFVVVPENGHLLSRSSASLLSNFCDWEQRRRPVLVKGRSVMVVDDDQAILKMMRIVFENAGFQVSSYGEAAAALIALAEVESPDVMVVDLRMPGMDGWHFVREVQHREIASRIVIASGDGAAAAQDELGADGSIAKPFDPDELISLVRNLPARSAI